DKCAIACARCRMKGPASFGVQFRPCWIRAAFEQKTSDVVVAEFDRSRQRPPAIRPGHADLFRVLVEDRLDAIEVSKCRCHGEIVRCPARNEQPCRTCVVRLGMSWCEPVPEHIPQTGNQDFPAWGPRPSSESTPY